MAIKCDVEISVESWPIAGAFTISRGSRTEAWVVAVTLITRQDANALRAAGRAECVPYPRYGESVESVVAQIKSIGEQCRNGIDRTRLATLLPAGAARNAVDCALWDLEARQSGKSAFAMAGIKHPQPLTTAYTLSLGTPEVMAEQAKLNRHRPVLKVKLGGDGDSERILAVAAAAPQSSLLLDANEAWSESNIVELLNIAKQAGVALVEQPLPAGKDGILSEIEHVVPICADESLHTRHELQALKMRYDCINIKLDKAGGLTEALALQKEARKQGFAIMVGCMVGTSLSMAPAMVLAQDADYVDLDGPLLLAKDRPHGLRYDGSLVHVPKSDLWG
jgi:L-alanine-DL-glutamate epimerase-like enolase superfamily enzyme